jgi:hypothetical protein
VQPAKTGKPKRTTTLTPAPIEPLTNFPLKGVPRASIRTRTKSFKLKRLKPPIKYPLKRGKSPKSPVDAVLKTASKLSKVIQKKRNKHVSEFEARLANLKKKSRKGSSRKG